MLTGPPGSLVRFRSRAKAWAHGQEMPRDVVWCLSEFIQALLHEVQSRNESSMTKSFEFCRVLHDQVWWHMVRPANKQVREEASTGLAVSESEPSHSEFISRCSCDFSTPGSMLQFNEHVVNVEQTRRRSRKALFACESELQNTVLCERWIGSLAEFSAWRAKGLYLLRKRLYCTVIWSLDIDNIEALHILTLNILNRLTHALGSQLMTDPSKAHSHLLAWTWRWLSRELWLCQILSHHFQWLRLMH